MTLSKSSRESGLDALRAIAIIAVMLYHFRRFLPESFGVIAQYGWMGVDLFFVLSGYLIGYQLLRPYSIGERPSVLTFYRRRLFRILPAYLVVVALYETVPAWREDPGFGPLWKFLTFTENIRFNPDFHAFSHAWSLCVEEHFYLLLPLLVVAMMRRPSVGKTILLMGAVMLGGMLLRFHALTPDVAYWPVIYYPTWMRLDGLLVGVALASVRVFRPLWWASLIQRGHATFLAGLIFVGFVMWLFRNDGLGDTQGAGAWGTVIGFPILAVGLGLVLSSSVSTNGLLSRFRIPGVRAIAALAFTLYLTHKGAAHLDRIYLPSLTSGRDVRTAMIYTVSCLAAALVLHFCVERPFMLLRDRFDKRPIQAIEQQMLADPAL
jgi:peptidoglycan/LPS O-acetylase OafA/YrhL